MIRRAPLAILVGALALGATACSSTKAQQTTDDTQSIDDASTSDATDKPDEVDTKNPEPNTGSGPTMILGDPTITGRLAQADVAKVTVEHQPEGGGIVIVEQPITYSRK